MSTPDNTATTLRDDLADQLTKQQRARGPIPDENGGFPPFFDVAGTLDRVSNYVSDVCTRRADGQLSEYEALQRIANYTADALDGWAAR